MKKYVFCISRRPKSDFDDPLSKNMDFGILERIPSNSADPVGSPGNGVIHCGSDPPTSRAGSQDDGSYTNSLK